MPSFFFMKNSFSNLFLYKRLINHVIKNEGSVSGFVDPDFFLATNSPSEIVFLLSITDLPFKKNRPIIKNNCITSEHNGILFSKRFLETSGEIKKSEIIISQRFYNKKGNNTFNNLSQDHPVEEFKKGQVYICRVVITNCSALNEKINVITEVPQGSLPINRTETLQALPLTIPSFQSRIISFSFYFPSDGKFSIYPACVTKNDQILAVSDISSEMVVKSIYENQVFYSISDVQLRGTLQDFFSFLDKIDYQTNINFFGEIPYVLENKELWEKTIEIIRKKGVFDENLWSYGIKHRNLQAIKEYFQFKSIKIPGIFYLKTELIEIDT